MHSVLVIAHHAQGQTNVRAFHQTTIIWGLSGKCQVFPCIAFTYWWLFSFWWPLQCTSENMFCVSGLTILCHQASWTMWYERLSRLTTKGDLARSSGESWWGKFQNDQRKRIWEKLTREEKEIFFCKRHQFFSPVGGRQSLDEDGLSVHQDARALCRGHHQ